MGIMCCSSLCVELLPSTCMYMYSTCTLYMRDVIQYMCVYMCINFTCTVHTLLYDRSYALFWRKMRLYSLSNLVHNILYYIMYTYRPACMLLHVHVSTLYVILCQRYMYIYMHVYMHCPKLNESCSSIQSNIFCTPRLNLSWYTSCMCTCVMYDCMLLQMFELKTVVHVILHILKV